MFSRARKLTAALAVALAVPLAAAGFAGELLTASAASAATPSCGSSCPDVFSREFGTHHNPAFVVDVLRQGEKTGQPVILFQGSNADPAEDWAGEFNGLTSDFYAAGLVSSAVALHYGCVAGTGDHQFSSCAGASDLPAFELEYSPYGVYSGLCAGLASTAASGEKVTLQPCGASAKTVWIIDTPDSPATVTHGYVPLINGSDTNFSHPFVLAYPQGGANPTDKPRPQLQVTNLTGFSNGFGPIVGTVPDYQLWGADFGVLK